MPRCCPRRPSRRGGELISDSGSRSRHPTTTTS
jgi:hypothetical protein